MIIVAISVFEKVGKYYPQGYLHQFFHELQKSCTKIALIFLKELTLIKEVHQKSLLFVIIGILKVLVIIFNHKGGPIFMG